MEFLPRPEVTHRYLDTSVTPPLDVMELRWHPDAPGNAERAWHLPQGVCIHGAAPERFGLAVQRRGDDAYKMQLVWNDLALTWNPITRVQIMTSSLALIVRALGTDLWHLVQQTSAPRAA